MSKESAGKLRETEFLAKTRFLCTISLHERPNFIGEEGRKDEGQPSVLPILPSSNITFYVSRFTSRFLLHDCFT